MEKKVFSRNSPDHAQFETERVERMTFIDIFQVEDKKGFFWKDTPLHRTFARDLGKENKKDYFMLRLLLAGRVAAPVDCDIFLLGNLFKIV